MERTWSNAFLSDSSWDCSRGKSSRSVRISLSTALRSPGAASAGPGSALLEILEIYSYNCIKQLSLTEKEAFQHLWPCIPSFA